VTAMIKAVVFDIGGVLERVDDMSWLEPWGRRAGISEQDIESKLTLFQLDDVIATGQLSEAAYKAHYAEALGLDAEGADEFMQDMWRWYCGELDQEMFDFAASLRPAYTTAILSNSADGARREEQVRYGFEQLVDVIIYSHEVGLAKPDHRIYQLTCERVVATPDEVVFIDDTPLVVDSANDFGLHAVLHVDTARTIAEVRALLEDSEQLLHRPALPAARRPDHARQRARLLEGHHVRMTGPAVDWTRLRAALSGELLRPVDDAYERVARWPLTTADQRMPTAIARCASARDVAAVVRFATGHEVDLAVRGGGHSFAGHSRTSGILIDTSLMRSISISANVDPTTHVGAGVRLGDLYDALHNANQTVPAGCGPTVGIAGLALGGGLGVLGRAHGLTSDALVGSEIVLADGTVTRCGPDRNPDLYWALRGAGSGNFGIVTELAFATIPEPSAGCFYLTWPSELAAELVAAWQHWLADAPETMAPSVHLSVPGRPSAEIQLRIFGAHIGASPQPDADLQSVVAAVGRAPTTRQTWPGSLRETKTRLSELGARFEAFSGSAADARTWSRSLFVARSLPAAVLEGLVDLTTGQRREGEARELDLMPMAGAYNQVPADATAFVHRDELYLLKYSVTLDDVAEQPIAQSWLDAVTALVAPHTTGRAYQNFPDPDLADPLTAYYGKNLQRLIRVKDRFDPGDVFHHDQSIPTTSQREGIN
jgi:epoxide hydrolase-like predicted phosphatase